MNLQDRLEADGWPDADPILFYGQRDDFGWMSNFSPHAINLPNPHTGASGLYDTGEHRYQAMKATTQEQHCHVKTANRPSVAKHRGQNVILRDGWGNNYADLCWYVMIEVVTAKVLQHDSIRRALEKTKDRPIYEDSPTDDIWGVRFRGDYRGKNLLGRCWMEVRATLIG